MTARAPGASACRAVATARNSASPWTMVPASVTGEVAPAMGTVYTSTGAPRAGRGRVEVEERPVDAQRRGRGEQRAEPRPRAERLGVAGDDVHDPQQRLGLRRAVDEGHVLARLGEDDVADDELAHLDRHVVRRDRRPQDVDLGHLVEQDRRRLQVGQGRRPPDAALVVEHEGGAARGAEVRRLALVQDHVVLGRRAGEDDAARARLDGAQHEVGREAHHARGEVDVGPEVGEDRQRGRPLELDPDALEKTQRLLDEGPLLGLVEPGHVRTHRASSDVHAPVGFMPPRAAGTLARAAACHAARPATAGGGRRARTAAARPRGRGPLRPSACPTAASSCSRPAGLRAPRPRARTPRCARRSSPRPPARCCAPARGCG